MLVKLTTEGEKNEAKKVWYVPDPALCHHHHDRDVGLE